MKNIHKSSRKIKLRVINLIKNCDSNAHSGPGCKDYDTEPYGTMIHNLKIIYYSISNIVIMFLNSSIDV